MARFWPAILLVIVPFGSALPEPTLPATKQVALNGHNFTLPAGFTIEMVAGPPLVDRPVTADFDEAGHLYVSDSSGSNEPVQVQMNKKPHRILRLTDSTGNGKYDKATVYADQMMFPAGTMWLGGSLYVAAPPSIWKLTDTDGDGIADKREEWFAGGTLTGCANDLHGPYRGPDGWIYWCKGAFAEQTYPGSAIGPKTSRAAHIFRSRPDGSGREAVMTGGMDNPVDVVFTPGGERIFSTTFLQRPAAGRRDGLIHAIYGGVYGKDNDAITSHPRTQPALMPVLTHLGPAAPSGLHRCESAAFGPEYRDNLFCAQFNLRKISRHVLIPDGATFRTQDEDFLTSDNFDFHPTDVIEDADGSLLVIDTGGWYKLCCPTTQLVKPDVLGAIYRIRREGMPKLDDPRGQKIAWKQLSYSDLTELLDDPRPAVVRRSMETLAKRGVTSIPALAALLKTNQSTAIARRNAIWTLCRIPDRSEIISASTLGLTDDDETVRQAAAHVAGLNRNIWAIDGLTKLLTNPSRHNRRVAAEALGRMGQTSPVGILLQAVADEKNDQVLDHSLTYALFEVAGQAISLYGIGDQRPRVRRAVLTTLEQSGTIDVNVVLAALQSSDASLKDTATWIVSRHPEWTNELADYFRMRLAGKLSDAEREELAGLLARMATQPAMQELLADTVRSLNSTSARIALRAMARARLKQIPDSWFIELTAALLRDDLIADAVATARAWNVSPKAPGHFVLALARIGGDAKSPEPLRMAAFAAIPAGKVQLDDVQFAWLCDRIGQNHSVATRSAAAEALTRAALTNFQLQRLTGVLKQTGPMEIVKLLTAFNTSKDEQVGLALISALNDSAVRPSLHADLVKQSIAKQSANVLKAAEPLFAALDADRAEVRTKVDRLAGELKGGDVRRGQVVFNSAKAACASCHAIGYGGGAVGPDLTHIGKIRTERDLLESIVVPSASFVRGYESVQVATLAGRQFNGLIRKDAAGEIVLTVNATEELRIARNEIETIAPSRVSIMPAGLDQQLSPGDLADLVAFLKACQ